MRFKSFAEKPLLSAKPIGSSQNLQTASSRQYVDMPRLVTVEAVKEEAVRARDTSNCRQLGYLQEYQKRPRFNADSPP
jgi:hypothetical protein